jgi:antitoxin VapB
MRAATIEIKKQAGVQAIELPEQFAIDDDKVYLKRTGNIISIIPFHNAWQNFYQSIDEFSEDFMTERNQPPAQPRESL